MTQALAIARSGTRVDLLAPTPAMIRVSDIGEGLAKIPRWLGATDGVFSVAQHSIIVAEEMAGFDGPLAALYGLLHDAHEYVIGDITEPAAIALSALSGMAVSLALSNLRHRIDTAIHAALDVDWPMPSGMKGLLDRVHECVRLTEMRDLVPACEAHLQAALAEGLRPLTRRILPYPNYIVADAKWRAALDKYTALAGLRRGHAFA
jgi:5'-deoxynucleotidase YfbR-like HD superfamily hydrolase